MLLGKRLGLEPQVLANIINKSTGACWSSKVSRSESCQAVYDVDVLYR